MSEVSGFSVVFSGKQSSKALEKPTELQVIVNKASARQLLKHPVAEGTQIFRAPSLL